MNCEGKGAFLNRWRAVDTEPLQAIRRPFGIALPSPGTMSVWSVKLSALPTHEILHHFETMVEAIICGQDSKHSRVS